MQWLLKNIYPYFCNTINYIELTMCFLKPMIVRISWQILAAILDLW